jgi:hypothetical protein
MKKVFVIKDMGKGTGTFLKILKKLCIEKEAFISFGDSHLVIKVSASDRNKIYLKFIDGPKKNESFTF